MIEWLASMYALIYFNLPYFTFLLFKLFCEGLDVPQVTQKNNEQQKQK